MYKPTKAQKRIKKAKDFEKIQIKKLLKKLIGSNNVEKYIHKPFKKYLGQSGFPRTPDYIIGVHTYDNKLKEGAVLEYGFIECKFTSSEKFGTYKEQIDRAFVQLCDLSKKYPQAKLFLIMNKPCKKKNEEYYCLFKVFNFSFIDITKKEDRQILKKEINKIIKKLKKKK